ncbi:hypothetical protein P12x_005763 [Tundrisphaera lichenicola]|uniref:hypothetical protein n=1 Tax=Tundrisphaera lichenicola TaxID=2029860 RepID=UPI003EB734C9
MKRVGMTDTSDEALRVLADVYRRMTPVRKLRLQAADYRAERDLHEAGFRKREPRATRDQIRSSWNLIRLGSGPWLSVGDELMDRPLDNLDVVREVVGAFDRLGIAHALGGSWASSYHGEPRSTRDADLTVEPFTGREADLVASFGPDYYVSLEAVREAVRGRRTFNIINTIAGFKVDVFVSKDLPFDRSVLRRRSAVEMPGDTNSPLVMISAEDTILLKLEGYRLGNQASERQWLDVLGVMRVQGERLDQGYLDLWAAELGVADLLGDARRDAAP